MLKGESASGQDLVMWHLHIGGGGTTGTPAQVARWLRCHLHFVIDIREVELQPLKSILLPSLINMISIERQSHNSNSVSACHAKLSRYI